MYKLAWNITYHWQLDQLKFHVDNIMKFECAKDSTFVFTSAHKFNTEQIHEYIVKNYPDAKCHYIWLPDDPGNHIGCINNVTEGIKFIKDNVEFDYLINVEADNMFWDESKMLKLIDKLAENGKHMLLVDHIPCFGEKLINRFAQSPCDYFHTTTINIYSKYFIDNFFPVDYYDEYMHFGWGTAPGTPYEAYLALSMIKKLDLFDHQKQIDFILSVSYPLTYSRDKKIFEGLYMPDDLTPDRFMKYGILNCPNARDSQGASNPGIWQIAKEFIEKHTPLMYDFD